MLVVSDVIYGLRFLPPRYSFVSFCSIPELMADSLQKMSHRLAKSRPFSPTVHVLILPSKLPLDLRLHFRDLDESRLVRPRSDYKVV